MIQKFLLSLFVLSLFCIAAPSIDAQSEAASAVRKVDLSQAEIDRIVQSVAAKETQYREALNLYGFKRQATIQKLGFGGQIAGEYRRDSQFLFTEGGRRYEKVLFAPLSPISNIVTAEDLEDLGGVNQFALESAKINQYNFTYLGKEKIDELDLYVFEVAPKVTPDPKKTKERFFQGRIWVDDRDLQIVKSKGKGVPETKENKFPVVETWRENIDGKFWFPTYSFANDQLFFEKYGNTLHIKMEIKFSEYKQATSSVRVLDDEEVVEEKPHTPPTAPKKP